MHLTALRWIRQPLAIGEQFNWLKSETFRRASSQNSARAAVTKICGLSKLTPPASSNPAKEIVLAGQGLGAGLQSQIAPELKQKRLVILPVDAPWLRLNYGFILKRGRTPSPAAVAFMETVRTIERGLAA